MPRWAPCAKRGPLAPFRLAPPHRDEPPKNRARAHTPRAPPTSAAPQRLPARTAIRAKRAGALPPPPKRAKSQHKRRAPPARRPRMRATQTARWLFLHAGGGAPNRCAKARLCTPPSLRFWNRASKALVAIARDRQAASATQRLPPSARQLGRAFPASAPLLLRARVSNWGTIRSRKPHGS